LKTVTSDELKDLNNSSRVTDHPLRIMVASNGPLTGLLESNSNPYPTSKVGMGVEGGHGCSFYLIRMYSVLT